MPPSRSSKRTRATRDASTEAPTSAAQSFHTSPKRPSAPKRAKKSAPEPTRISSRNLTGTMAGGHRLRSTPARKEAAASTKAASRQTKGAPSKGRTKAGAAAKTVLPGLAHLDFGFTFEVLRPSKKQKLTMFAFGQGDDGQFGLGPVNADGEEWDDELGAPTRSVPVDDLTKANAFGPQGLRDVFTSLSQSSFGIDSKGQLWSWGYNDQGQLARPTQFPDDKPEDKDDLTRERQSKPDRVEALKPPAFLATKVASGDQINAAVSSVGKVQIWGAYRGVEGKFPFSGVTDTDLIQPLPLPLSFATSTKIVDIAAGNDHFVACDDKGTVWTWGTGEAGTLGREVRPARSGRGKGNALDPDSALNVNKVTPHQVAIDHHSKIVSVAAGFKNCFAISQSGEVFAWGANNYRQLGFFDQDKSIIEHPQHVEALNPNNFDGHKVVQIASGEHHSVFLFDDGMVRTCGRCDSDHQTGIDKDHEQYKKAKARVDKARAEILRLKQENKERLIKEAEEAGKDLRTEMVQIEVTAEEIAQEAAEEPSQSVDELVTLEFQEEEEGKPTRIIQVITGPRHTLAVSANGYVYAWGSGQTCQLGHGTNTDVLEKPSRIKRGKLAETWRVFKAAAGGTHNLLLAELREQAGDSVKPSSRQMVDATLRVKPYKAPRAEAETDGDSEMTPAASEAGANGDAAPAAEDSEMNSS